jgi:ceramide glucosyltransferase
LHFYWLLFLPAAAYQCLSIAAALKHLAKADPPPAAEPQSVSVLKPLRGLDPNTREAFISQITQNHPQFEVLFGARDAADPAALAVERLQHDFPQAPIRLIIGSDDAPNAKVGTLAELSRHARYPLRVVNDSDIKVDPDYLARVTAPLRDPAIGVVTCLYRVKPHNVPAAWEALGIMTDFMPSTLVAQLIGVREFGLGSTLAFRAADLEQTGGFASLAAYIADDYQLAKNITGQGKRALLSTYVVETSLGDATWRGIWLHQLRWARTIRLTKGAGHLGLPITHAGLWAAIALATGAFLPALILLTLRILSALLGGGFVLRSPFAACFCWLSPLWDLYSFFIWLTSYAGKTVRWRDRTLRVDPGGRIIKS